MFVPSLLVLLPKNVGVGDWTAVEFSTHDGCLDMCQRMLLPPNIHKTHLAIVSRCWDVGTETEKALHEHPVRHCLFVTATVWISSHC
jgi:hypothetical protein